MASCRGILCGSLEAGKSRDFLRVFIKLNNITAISWLAARGYLQVSRNVEMSSSAASSPACLDMCWKPDLGVVNGHDPAVVLLNWHGHDHNLHKKASPKK